MTMVVSTPTTKPQESAGGAMLPSYHRRHELYPLQTLPKARRGYRRLPNQAGKLETRCFLESATPSITSTTPSASGYIIDSLICKQPTGVSVLLAHPITTTHGTSSSIIHGGQSVVIKASPQQKSRPPREIIDQPLIEIAAMQHLQQSQQQHPNVITLLDCMQDDDFVYMVLPYLKGGDLFSRVEAGPIPEAESLHFFRQMIKGLLFMKETTRMAHHDVSLENVMLTHAGGDEVKIIDLGMCVRVPKVLNDSEANEPVCLAPEPSRGKPGYVAPEVVREEPCDPFAADIWSLGVCLYIMLTGRPLYSTPRDPAFKILCQECGVQQVLMAYEHYGLHVSPWAKDLIHRMLHADPRKRPTLEQILYHPLLLGEGQDKIPCPASVATGSGCCTGDDEQQAHCRHARVAVQ